MFVEATQSLSCPTCPPDSPIDAAVASIWSGVKCLAATPAHRRCIDSGGRGPFAAIERAWFICSGERGTGAPGAAALSSTPELVVSAGPLADSSPGEDDSEVAAGAPSV